MSRRRLFSLVVALVLALLALALGLQNRFASPAPAPEPAPAARDAARPPITPRVPPTTANEPRMATPALPPPGTPVGALASALKPRADAGDSRAACRLAVELLRCRTLREMDAVTVPDRVPADVRMAKMGHPEFADRLAEMAIRRIQLKQACEAVDPALVRRAPHYLAMAARAGEPEAMLRYATGEHHGFMGLGFSADPEFERWRRESPAMLLGAARAGRTEAVNLMRLAYESDLTPFAGLVANDPVQAHAWAIILAGLRGGAPLAPLESMDAAAVAEAEALAEDWYPRYFRDAPVREGSPALFLMPLADPIQPAEEERFCD